MRYLFFVVLSLWISGNLAELPYGCKECNQKGYTFCEDSGTYTCWRNVASCSSRTANVVPLSQCTPAYVPAMCPDYNGNCAACNAATVPGGCSMCMTTGQYCVAKGDICHGVTACSGTDYNTNLNCNGKTSCSTCMADSTCAYIPDLVNSQAPGGCMIKGASYSDWFSPAGACTDQDVICPARTSGTFTDMCKCLVDSTGKTDLKCILCYSAEEPEFQYRCTNLNQPECTQSYQSCTDPAVVCPPLINPFDPWGTRCNCLTNTNCAICVTNSVSDITPSTLKCVPKTNTKESCSSLVTNCNDPAVTCPTRLTCGDCTSTTGCTWCNSGDIGFTPKCVASGGCAAPFVADDGTCSDKCYQYTTCTNCQNGGCKWCNNTDYTKSSCTKYCDTTVSKQTVVSSCSAGDQCTNYDTCTNCLAKSGCTWCEGKGRHDGSSSGRFCTSNSICNNLQGCGVWQPCVADIYHNASSCPTTNFCKNYANCLTCQGQTDVPQKCYWCDDGGTRYCDTTCKTNGKNAVKVASCAYFGATTGGLTNLGTGNTNQPSTGSAGTTPSGFIPPPGTPGVVPAPGTPTAGPSGNPSAPSGGNPSSPSGGNPSSPSGGNPSSPSGGNPSSPSGGNPSSPSGGNPSSPSGGNPSSPSGGNPSSPSGGNPSSPSGGNPSSPSGGNPSGNGPSSVGPSGTPADGPSVVGPSSVGPSGTPADGPAVVGPSKNPSGATSGGSSGGSTGTNQGILGGGRGVVDGFDWALFGIILGVIVILIICIVIIVIVVKGSATETV